MRQYDGILTMTNLRLQQSPMLANSAPQRRRRGGGGEGVDTDQRSPTTGGRELSTIKEYYFPSGMFSGTEGKEADLAGIPPHAEDHLSSVMRRRRAIAELRQRRQTEREAAGKNTDSARRKARIASRSGGGGGARHSGALDGGTSAPPSATKQVSNPSLGSVPYGSDLLVPPENEASASEASIFNSADFYGATYYNSTTSRGAIAAVAGGHNAPTRPQALAPTGSADLAVASGATTTRKVVEVKAKRTVVSGSRTKEERRATGQRAVPQAVPATSGPPPARNEVSDSFADGWLGYMENSPSQQQLPPDVLSPSFTRGTGGVNHGAAVSSPMGGNSSLTPTTGSKVKRPTKSPKAKAVEPLGSPRGLKPPRALKPLDPSGYDLGMSDIDDDTDAPEETKPKSTAASSTPVRGKSNGVENNGATETAGRSKHATSNGHSGASPTGPDSESSKARREHLQRGAQPPAPLPTVQLTSSSSPLQQRRLSGSARWNQAPTSGAGSPRRGEGSITSGAGAAPGPSEPRATSSSGVAQSGTAHSAPQSRTNYRSGGGGGNGPASPHAQTQRLPTAAEDFISPTARPGDYFGMSSREGDVSEPGHETGATNSRTLPQFSRVGKNEGTNMLWLTSSDSHHRNGMPQLSLPRGASGPASTPSPARAGGVPQPPGAKSGSKDTPLPQFSGSLEPLTVRAVDAKELTLQLESALATPRTPATASKGPPSQSSNPPPRHHHHSPSPQQQQQQQVAAPRSQSPQPEDKARAVSPASQAAAAAARVATRDASTTATRSVLLVDQGELDSTSSPAAMARAEALRSCEAKSGCFDETVRILSAEEGADSTIMREAARLVASGVCANVMGVHAVRRRPADCRAWCGALPCFFRTFFDLVYSSAAQRRGDDASVQVCVILLKQDMYRDLLGHTALSRRVTLAGSPLLGPRLSRAKRYVATSAEEVERTLGLAHEQLSSDDYVKGCVVVQVLVHQRIVRNRHRNTASSTSSGSSHGGTTDDLLSSLFAAFANTDVWRELLLNTLPVTGGILRHAFSGSVQGHVVVNTRRMTVPELEVALQVQRVLCKVRTSLLRTGRVQGFLDHVDQLLKVVSDAEEEANKRLSLCYADVVRRADRKAKRLRNAGRHPIPNRRRLEAALQQARGHYRNAKLFRLDVVHKKEALRTFRRVYRNVLKEAVTSLPPEFALRTDGSVVSHNIGVQSILNSTSLAMSGLVLFASGRKPCESEETTIRASPPPAENAKGDHQSPPPGGGSGTGRKTGGAGNGGSSSGNTPGPERKPGAKPFPEHRTRNVVEKWTSTVPQPNLFAGDYALPARGIRPLFQTSDPYVRSVFVPASPGQGRDTPPETMVLSASPSLASSSEDDRVRSVIFVENNGAAQGGSSAMPAEVLASAARSTVTTVTSEDKRVFQATEVCVRTGAGGAGGDFEQASPVSGSWQFSHSTVLREALRGFAQGHNTHVLCLCGGDGGTEATRRLMHSPVWSALREMVEEVLTELDRSSAAPLTPSVSLSGSSGNTTARVLYVSVTQPLTPRLVRDHLCLTGADTTSRVVSGNDLLSNRDDTALRFRTAWTPAGPVVEGARFIPITSLGQFWKLIRDLTTRLLTYNANSAHLIVSFLLKQVYSDSSRPAPSLGHSPSTVSGCGGSTSALSFSTASSPTLLSRIGARSREDVWLSSLQVSMSTDASFLTAAASPAAVTMEHKLNLLRPPYRHRVVCVADISTSAADSTLCLHALEQLAAGMTVPFMHSVWSLRAYVTYLDDCATGMRQGLAKLAAASADAAAASSSSTNNGGGNSLRRGRTSPAELLNALLASYARPALVSSPSAEPFTPGKNTSACDIAAALLQIERMLSVAVDTLESQFAVRSASFDKDRYTNPHPKVLTENGELYDVTEPPEWYQTRISTRAPKTAEPNGASSPKTQDLQKRADNEMLQRAVSEWQRAKAAMAVQDEAPLQANGADEDGTSAADAGDENGEASGKERDAAAGGERGARTADATAAGATALVTAAAAAMDGGGSALDGGSRLLELSTADGGIDFRFALVGGLGNSNAAHFSVCMDSVFDNFGASLNAPTGLLESFASPTEPFAISTPPPPPMGGQAALASDAVVLTLEPPAGRKSLGVPSQPHHFLPAPESHAKEPAPKEASRSKAHRRNTVPNGGGQPVKIPVLHSRQEVPPSSKKGGGGGHRGRQSELTPRPFKGDEERGATRGRSVSAPRTVRRN